MSTHIWPLTPGQTFIVAPRTSDLPGIELNDNEIIETLTLPQANVLIMLAPARVLVYQYKPLALIAAHERTASSVTEFGRNKSMASSIIFDKPIDGLMTAKDSNQLSNLKGKTVFYVITEGNFLLTFQILRNTSYATVFKDYGIPVLDLARHSENMEELFDNTIDDDTLTVFDRNKSSRVIQNGYAITKEKRFLQFLVSNNEVENEMPIKKAELRLKVILKFDSNILDILAFKKFSDDKDGRFEENLLMLFPHGLQILSLKDFKLQGSSTIKIKNGFKICTCNDKLIVVSEDKINKSQAINIINFKELTCQEFLLNNNSTLITCLEYSNRILLVFHNKIKYFNIKTKKSDYEWDAPFPIKLCKKLESNLLLLISEHNALHFVTPFGNSLFSTDYDDDSSKSSSFEYVNFAFMDKTLVTVCKDGSFQVWNFWEEIKDSCFNFRSPRPYLFSNNFNDIMFYTSLGEAPLNHDSFPITKLPTRTPNNHVSLTKVNGNMKLLAVHISNKNLLLIQNMETNAWISFSDLIIIDMYWLGNNYLVCQIKGDDGSISIECARIPLQKPSNIEFSEYIIWRYDVPESMANCRIFVNTLYRYKLLKVKSKETEINEKQQLEKFYKTAEVVLVSPKETIIFDVISNITISGLNIVRSFYKYATIKLPSELRSDSINWVTNYKDGLLIFSDSTMTKVTPIGENNWQHVELLQQVERVLDVIKDEIFIMQGKKLLIYKLDDLWEDKQALLTINVEENLYPVSVSPEYAVTNSLHCVFNDNFSKLVVGHEIYLDKLILAKMNEGTPLETITDDYHSLKHYKFALEKILSFKILKDDDLQEILQLIKLCHSTPEQSSKNPHHDFLEIISNCLRKIETKYWNMLFNSLKMTPRDLLALCLESKEAQILGVLLIVFLNYDEVDLLNDLRLENREQKETIHEEDQEDKFAPPLTGSSDNLNDEELMLRVLRVLVTNAASETDPNKASESWDMCFQLVRLLKELDKQNHTRLVQTAIEMFQLS
ncbi:hypothetical protein KAFR_0F02650 [Kazachstania africana CBS 2517]|uniref:RIC1 C-terminal alpha solenoid region domain-containing protein n=1 Tax=Kazachstania africana (strain ATCC 22294 / BCRC 22015 / CBS 2517 / CECT 1963 / NBRC 1671 / NRRL Y-8276) TaxID=1071382 RepID=H2AWW2_KAZAF|nr:hypothetical protein KAFR_0F02650 [Kazachstania africana CBS 2517]CCF58862.1 hypothetical protein KAFR_0F02650 [Kazachstania africana CBS 2517]